jgi:NAD(P)-dependent dehydrogenase (short-subunit alcohol dehydrogenase family)
MKRLNPPITDWQDRRVWIVGASTGIGAALARALGGAGARLALSARGAAKLDALAAALPRALALPLDVRDAAGLAQAYAKIRRAWGDADLVVCNAGTYAPLRADAFDLGAMNEHFAINFHGVTNTLAAVLPDFVARAHEHPALAIVSSVAGYRGLPRALAYGPSKAALINLAETLYLDLSPRGIGIHLINPGFVETPLTAQNDFKMPALISAEEAARQIMAGFARGEFETHFPKRFTGVLKTLRALPYRAYFAAVRKGVGV